MSVNMFLGNAEEQSFNITSMCQTHVQGMEKVKTAISQFMAETQLKGKTYDSAKQYFGNVYLPLANGIILAAEALKVAVHKFTANYQAEVDSNSLQEDLLRSQIQRLNHLTDFADHLATAAPKGTVLGNSFHRMASHYQNQKQKQQEKLEKLLAFHPASAKIFTEVEQLLQSVEAGLKEAGSGKGFNAATGTFSTARLNMDWTNIINTRWNNQNGTDQLDGVFSKEGSYGGDQGSPLNAFLSGDEEIRAILRKYFPDMTEKEMKKFLTKLNDEGCGYVALVNGFLDHYTGSAKEFEKEFGFPLYNKVNGEKVLNYNYLLVDLYAAEDNHHSFLYFWDRVDKNEDNSDTDGNGTSQKDREYRFTKYMEAHDTEVSFKNHIEPTSKNYEKYKDQGELILSVNPVILEDENGIKTKQEGGHAVSITGKTKDGRLIVSSWGDLYYVDPKDYQNAEKFEMQVITYE